MTNVGLTVFRILGVLTLCLGVSVYTAQRGGRGRRERNRILEPSELLASVTTLKCSFPASAAVTWTGVDPQIQVTKPSPAFTLTITEIDAQEGTARVVGLGAAAHVTVKLAGSNLHFLDIRSTGALAITTVFSAESHDGRLKAVHSRSEYVGSAVRGAADPPDVSQYYGDCEVGRR